MNDVVRCVSGFRLVVVILLLAGCTAGQGEETTGPDITTTSRPATTNTSFTTVQETTTPVDSAPTTTSDPIVLDGMLNSPTAPWHSVAVESDRLTVSGHVTPGSKVTLRVLSPSVGGQIVFEGTATVESDYFEGEVVLVPGRNRVALVAEAPNGTTSRADIDARYEPTATVEFAYVTRVGPTEIEADYAQWLTGDMANQAAFEDGAISSADEGVPNDYHIRNTNPRLRVLPLADDTAVWLATGAEGGVRMVAVSADEWLGLFNDGRPWDYEVDEPPEWEGPHHGYLGASTVYAPYWLVILDGEVIAIEQQYLP